MAPATSSRRAFMATTGSVALGALAGCSDGASVDEVESNIESAVGHLEEIDPALEAIGGHVQDEDWQACLAGVDDLRADVEAARGDAEDALELAEAGGFEDHAAASERVVEYTGIVGDMADEMERLCEAGRDGEQAEVERRWAAVQDLDDDRQAKREEVTDAIDRLRG